MLLDCMTLAYVDKQLMSLELGHNYSVNYEERPLELADKPLGMVLRKKVSKITSKLPRELRSTVLPLSEHRQSPAVAQEVHGQIQLGQ